MTGHVGEGLRHLVAARANRICEYCLVHEDDRPFGCEVDHIISEKHGRPTVAGNLAFACSACNRLKGSDVGSICWATGDFVRLYNPRTDRWHDHFRLRAAVIDPLTPIGEVTVHVLSLNRADRLLERQALMAVERYPTPAALDYLGRQTAAC